jgi:hypothetical protein
MVPNSLTNLEDEQDRSHCRLDLDSVTDAPSALRFVQTWRRALEGYLIDPPEDEDAAEEWREREAKLEKDLDKADSELDYAKIVIDDIAQRVEDLENDDPEDVRAGVIADRLTELSERIEAFRRGWE